MTKQSSRRTFVGTLSVAMYGLLSGCGGVEYPRNRSLGFTVVKIIEEQNGTYEMGVEFKKSATGSSDEWNTFHDVRILGYTRSGKLACEKKLGAVTRDSQQKVELSCSGFPYLLTFDAAESPCDEDTELGIATYQADATIEKSWQTKWHGGRPRHCDEPLPPEDLLPNANGG